MKLYKKIILTSALIPIALITNVKYISAAEVGFGSLSEESAGDIPYTDWTSPETGYKKGNKAYSYRYKKIIAPDTTIYMNAYDLEGNSVMPNKMEIDSTKYTFKSGTWIGINVLETQSVSWLVSDIQYREVTKEYKCVYYGRQVTDYVTNHNTSKRACDARNGTFSPYPNGNGLGSCVTKTYRWQTGYTKPETKDYYESYFCPEHNDYGQSLNKDASTVTVKYGNVVNGSVDTTMRENIASKVEKEASKYLGSSVGVVEYITSEDYPTEKENLTYSTIKATEVPNSYSQTRKNSTSGIIKQDYEYIQSKVCINLKTAEVAYGETCDSEKYTNIKNGTIWEESLNKNVNYWHYFIPLNTKSNEDFYLRIMENTNRPLSKEECKSVIQKYSSNYKDYIIPKIGDKNFIGDYKKYKEQSNDWKNIERNDGCYFSTTIHIPVTQKFYGEETDKKGNTTLKGFNFYYRPIDINNPFPNGIANDSYWKEWADNKKKNPELTKSFDQITYKIDNVNTKEIREYTKNYKYTDWSNMNINGTSNFVTSYLNRNIKLDTFYKLGCGPANESWEECGR